MQQFSKQQTYQVFLRLKSIQKLQELSRNNLMEDKETAGTLSVARTSGHTLPMNMALSFIFLSKICMFVHLELIEFKRFLISESSQLFLLIIQVASVIVLCNQSDLLQFSILHIKPWFASYMSLSNLHDSRQFYLISSTKIGQKLKGASASTASSQSQKNYEDIADLKQEKVSYIRLQPIQKIERIISKNMNQVKELGQTIGNSDKLVRITSSMLKIMKNFGLISNLKKFDKLSYQIGMTRRVFRFNRKYYTLKELKNGITNIFLNKSHTVTAMDIFNLFFKLFILVSDLNDLTSYLMQLRILPNQKNPAFIRRTMNFYFFQCLVWLALHIYQYVKMEIQKRNANKQGSTVKAPSQNQLKTKRLTIIKYICDSLTSHNDYSQKKWSIKPKTVSVIGMVSSLVGLNMVWK